jgi:hypothetical protein
LPRVRAHEALRSEALWLLALPAAAAAAVFANRPGREQTWPRRHRGGLCRGALCTFFSREPTSKRNASRPACLLSASGRRLAHTAAAAARPRRRGNKTRRPGFSRSLRFRPLSGGSLPVEAVVRSSSHRAQMAVTSGASRVGIPHSPRPCAPHVRHVCASPHASTACWRPPPCAMHSL